MLMHKLMAAVVSFTLSGLAFAVVPADAAHAKKKVPAKQVAKSVAAKSKAAHMAKAAPLVAAVPMVASVVADPKQQDVIADLVHTGRMVCELGNFVTVTPDSESSTRFIVQMKKNTYHMSPVETTTGAVRLEDPQAGAMWLQLQNKSMLMNSKLGQRMADECQSPNQMAVAEAMKLAPPPSLLDAPTLAKK
jgi:hypothetical protein